MLKIFLILLLVSNCTSMVVKIDPVKDFTKDYFAIDVENSTDIQLYQHAIIVGRKEIDYLKEYIEILQNRIRTANGQLLYVLETEKPPKE